MLYDNDLSPVYSGQAGLSKGTKTNGGACLGDRLSQHINGKYRNGWTYFSWFGFLDCEHEKEIKGKLKKLEGDAGLALKKDPGWIFNGFPKEQDLELKSLLDSFEAVLIEAFVPRFNARGGNVKGAVYVDQFEDIPSNLKDDR